mgnify:FL=1
MQLLVSDPVCFVDASLRARHSSPSLPPHILRPSSFFSLLRPCSTRYVEADLGGQSLLPSKRVFRQLQASISFVVSSCVNWLFSPGFLSPSPRRKRLSGSFSRVPAAFWLQQEINLYLLALSGAARSLRSSIPGPGQVPPAHFFPVQEEEQDAFYACDAIHDRADALKTLPLPRQRQISRRRGDPPFLN